MHFIQSAHEAYEGYDGTMLIIGIWQMNTAVAVAVVVWPDLAGAALCIDVRTNTDDVGTSETRPMIKDPTTLAVTLQKELSIVSSFCSIVASMYERQLSKSP